MKFREIFRFEFAYQFRRVQTWLFFAVLAGFAFLQIGEAISAARSGEQFLNTPFDVAIATVFGSLIWLLVAPAEIGRAHV